MVTHAVLFEIIPDLAIDTFRTLPNGRPNPNYGNLYVAWTRIYSAGQFPGSPMRRRDRHHDRRVEGCGRSWDTRMRELDAIPRTTIEDSVNDPGTYAGLASVDRARLAVGPEGDVYVSNSAAAISVSTTRQTPGGVSSVPIIKPAKGSHLHWDVDVSDGRWAAQQSIPYPHRPRDGCRSRPPRPPLRRGARSCHRSVGKPA